MKEVAIYNLDGTRELGIKVGKATQGLLCTIMLQGDLGVGKTTMCKAIVEGRLGEPLEVQSPTFNLLNVYENTKGKVYHYDLYRLKSQEELLELGLEDALLEDNLAVFEWPEKAASFLHSLPLNKILVTLNFNGENQRTAQLEGLPELQMPLR